MGCFQLRVIQTISERPFYGGPFGGFAVVVGGSSSIPALIGPTILTLLLRYVSGVKMSEVDLQERDGYQEWISTTPAMFANPVRALLKKNAD